MQNMSSMINTLSNNSNNCFYLTITIFVCPVSKLMLIIERLNAVLSQSNIHGDRAVIIGIKNR